jgi:hypothetical protein
MGVTSMGIFGFLSKAHSDQSLVSGDVQSKIAVYDEKIKTARENIDANRKALKQLDEAVDQVMGRSNDEKGAEKAVNIRRAQQKERTRLQTEIAAEQKTISSISEERAPIAAEVRKVEAEVGPIKYIAQFVYGESDQGLLEKAVTWVIVILIIVFDPLAVILLLSSQISFQNFRDRKAEGDSPSGPVVDIVSTEPTVTELAEGDSPGGTTEVVDPEPPTVTEPVINKQTHPYLYTGDFWKKPEGWVDVGPITNTITPTVSLADLKPELTLPDLVKQHGYSSDKGIVKVAGFEYTESEFERLMSSGYIQNEEQKESGTWNKVISEQEYREQVEKQRNESKDNPNNAA